MKKLLITGFEPFGGEVINPSWEAVSLLPEKIGEYNLTKVRIPVVFEKSAQIVIDEAEKLCPDAIICVGQASGRSSITPEYVAINIRNAKMPDNEGQCPSDQLIVEGGETAYFSTIQVRKIEQSLSNAGIPTQISYSAGTYVCNDVLYKLLAHFNNSDVKVGFIHVPYSKEQSKEPCMELAEIVKGLSIAIENV